MNAQGKNFPSLHDRHKCSLETVLDLGTGFRHLEQQMPSGNFRISTDRNSLKLELSAIPTCNTEGDGQCGVSRKVMVDTREKMNEETKLILKWNITAG